MLGVGGAGGFGFFFLLEPRPEAVPTKLRWDFFFLVFRDSELLVPAERERHGMKVQLLREEGTHLPEPESRCAAYLNPIPDFH